MNGNIDAPHVRRFCFQCKEVTGTVFKPMPAGIGNACNQCGMFRKQKPYISKREFKSLRPEQAQGGSHESNRVG
ncbi:hypothetical protein P4B35_08620 [Pontiellaceae bacterium B12227]|nr:hypothetical protein [Pontiellaceae bacterium B12227]